MKTAIQQNLDWLKDLLEQNKALEREIEETLEKVRSNQRCLAFVIDETEKVVNILCPPKEPDHFVNGYLTAG